VKINFKINTKKVVKQKILKRCYVGSKKNSHINGQFIDYLLYIILFENNPKLFVKK
jgi:hypothetical protein